MTRGRKGGTRQPGMRGAAVFATSLALLLAGCAPISKFKSRVMVQPVAAKDAAPQPGGGPVSDTSLTAIINNQILRGHYVEGEKALRSYLVQHPADRAAEALLRQLTVDPRQMLGREGSVYVVQPGDSWSILAARYLGDSGLFLVLARYNGSTNPSLLRAGERLHMPLSAMGDGHSNGAVAAESTTQPASNGSPQGPVPGSKRIAESSSVKAARLQQESIALMNQGKQDEALSRLDQALTIDPQLRPSGPASVSLRKRLVASYHQRAIVLYRDQQLDQAITLWDRALAIDPGFEPAVIYRARAMELKLRLKQL
ncbi:MAG: LysM peptidoglycan-binding domain-containing protein [Rhodanobacter sp.]